MSLTLYGTSLGSALELPNVKRYESDCTYPPMCIGQPSPPGFFVSPSPSRDLYTEASINTLADLTSDRHLAQQHRLSTTPAGRCIIKQYLKRQPQGPRRQFPQAPWTADVPACALPRDTASAFTAGGPNNANWTEYRWHSSG